MNILRNENIDGKDLFLLSVLFRRFVIFAKYLFKLHAISYELFSILLSMFSSSGNLFKDTLLLFLTICM